MILKIDMITGKDMPPILVEILREQFERAICDVLLPAGKGFDFDSAWGAFDHSIYERQEQLNNAGRLTEIHSTFVDDIAYLLASTPDITLNISSE